MYRLFLRIFPPEDTPRDVLIDQFPATLGRSLENDLPLPFLSVSGRHLELRSHPGGLELIDLGSTNGSFLNEARLTPGTPYPVSGPFSLRLGDLPIDAIPEKLAPSSPTSSQDETATGVAVSFTSAHSQTALHAIIADLDADDQNPKVPYLEVLNSPHQALHLPLDLLVPNFLSSTPIPSLRSGKSEEATGNDLAELVWQDQTFVLTPLQEGWQLDATPVDGPLSVQNGMILTHMDLSFRFVDPLETALQILSLSSSSEHRSKNSIDVPVTAGTTGNTAFGPVQEPLAPLRNPRPQHDENSTKKTLHPGRFGAFEFGLLALCLVLMASTLSLFYFLFH